MCGSCTPTFDVIGTQALRSALAADAGRPLHLRALMEVDRLHELLSPTASVLDASLTSRLLREADHPEISS